jgi:hypothetical protein
VGAALGRYNRISSLLKWKSEKHVKTFFARGLLVALYVHVGTGGALPVIQGGLLSRLIEVEPPSHVDLGAF